MSTLTSFLLFPDLPTEIRLKIYSHILSTPRTVTLTCNKLPSIRGQPRAVKSFTSPTPIPVLLHVSRETRHEALLVYSMHFKHPLSASCTYFNLSVDTLQLPDGTLGYLKSSLPEELARVERLALETRDWAYFGHYNMESIRGMSGLRSLDVTAWRGAVYGWDAGYDYVGKVVRAFEEAKREDPGWVCPEVRVVEGEKGVLAGEVEAGALIPGWTEETAHLYEDADA